MASADETQRLLDGVREGRRDAWDRLFEIVYDDLRRIARSHVRGRVTGTLGTTAIVNEAYLRLAGHSVSLNDRVHFMAVASRAMRCVLVDEARRRYALKRGAGAERVELDGEDGPALAADDPASFRVLELERALERLGELNERLAQVVELRFFGGLSVKEAAEVLGVGERTVERDWFKARSFLHRELSRA
jgi:RNA polymerase sigma factor (TIGR02999 family)